MNRAYLFPFSVPVDSDHIHHATPVTLASPYPDLVQASRQERLRCPYAHCLGKVKPMRYDARSDELRCFSHVPAADAPPCPFRTESWSDDDVDDGGRRITPEHNLRKRVESALVIELQRSFARQGRTDVRVEGSAYKRREPLIRIRGLEVPVEVRGLAPGCEALWTEPFDGTVDGAQVLFFAVASDLVQLRKKFLDEHLLSVRPAMVVTPGQTVDAEHTWTATSALAGPPGEKRRFDEIDLARVDHPRLFGTDRPAEYLFVPAAHREAVAKLAERLGVKDPPAVVVTLLRTLAESALVQGAGVRAPLFPHAELTARDLLTLLGNRDLHAFCSADAVLSPLWSAYVNGAFAGLDRTIAALRAELAPVQEKLSASERARKELEARVAAREAEAASVRAESESRKMQLEAARANAAKAEEQARRDLAAANAKLDAAETRAKRLETELTAARAAVAAERQERAKVEHTVVWRLASWFSH